LVDFLGRSSNKKTFSSHEDEKVSKSFRGTTSVCGLSLTTHAHFPDPSPGICCNGQSRVVLLFLDQISSTNQPRDFSRAFAEGAFSRWPPVSTSGLTVYLTRLSVYCKFSALYLQKVRPSTGGIILENIVQPSGARN